MAIGHEVRVRKPVRKDRGHSTIEAESAVAADGAGMTASRGSTSREPAPLLNFVVRRVVHRSLLMPDPSSKRLTMGDILILLSGSLGCLSLIAVPIIAVVFLVANSVFNKEFSFLSPWLWLPAVLGVLLFGGAGVLAQKVYRIQLSFAKLVGLLVGIGSRLFLAEAPAGGPGAVDVATFREVYTKLTDQLSAKGIQVCAEFVNQATEADLSDLARKLQAATPDEMRQIAERLDAGDSSVLKGESAKNEPT
jgi:hypothetical protein